MGRLSSRKWLYLPLSPTFNPWNVGGSLMVQKMAITSSVPDFQPLETGWVVYGPEYGYNFPNLRLLTVKEHTVCNNIRIEIML